MKSKRLITGIVLIIILLAIPFTYADSYYKSVIDIADDNYIIFGDEEAPLNIKNGIEIDMVLDSASHSQIDIIVNVDPGVISERQIDKFLVIWNGKIVHEFYPQLYINQWTGLHDYMVYYYIKPSNFDFTGGYIHSQVVGVQRQYNAQMGTYLQYAVAWSEPSPVTRLKPFPVVDAEGNYWLGQIYIKLSEMLSKLASMDNKLARISDQLATLLTPSPQASARLENAMNELREAMPMQEMSEKNQEISNMFKNTQTDAPYSKLTFGDAKDYFGIGVAVHLFDLSQYLEIIKTMRELLRAIVWVEFFMFILFYLAPKLDI